jgi:amino acid transporter
MIPPSASAPSTGLLRGLGKWDLTALVINTLVGAGIFGLPAKVFGLAGSYSLPAYLACALLASLIVLCFAEVGSRFAETGGPYLYARYTFGPWVGFGMGWLMWLARITSFAALSNLLVAYLGFFWPALAAGAGRAGVITVIVLVFAVVNLLGVRESARMSNLLTVAKLIPLLVFVAVGVFFAAPERLAPAVSSPDFGSFSKAVLLLVFAFTGFEMAGIPSGEARDPKRHLPFALIVSIAGVTLLYLSIQFVCMETLPGLAGSDKPLADAARIFLGPWGASLIAAGAVISVAGTLNAIMLAGPRLLFAMAEQGQLPAFLGAAHRRFRTPHAAISVSAVAMLALALSGTFLYAATLSTLIKLLTFMVTCLALIFIRRRGDAPPALFRLSGGVFIASAALGLCAWLLASGSWREVRDVSLATVLGMFIYLAFRARKNPASQTGNST